MGEHRAPVWFPLHDISLPQSMKTHSSSSRFASLLSLLLAALIWLLFAPTRLGGQMTYVIVDGNSMEPRFHFGDLVLVRKRSAYQVGDAVTYRNAELGRFVFHRIISLDSDRFVLKGDNNSWLDSYRPGQDEIIGELWLHIPTFGKGIEWLRRPINFALASSLLGGILMSSMMVASPRPPKRNNQSAGGFAAVREGGLYLAGFLSLCFLGLSIFAFTRPLTRSTGNAQYQQEGFFYYSATGAPGLYDTDKVRPGEPVFPRLTCFLNLAYAYNLTGDQVQRISGSHQLYARVFDEGSGWQRTIPLQAETSFSSSTFFSVATLDICQVESMVSLLEQQTGLRASVFTLEIVSQMAFTGEVAGKAISDTFNPGLVFKFDKVHFYLPDDETQDDRLHVTKQGLVGSSGLETNTLPFMGWEPTVPAARIIALLGLGVSLGALLILCWPLVTTARESREALIRLKYGALLMDIHDRDLEPTAPIIDVTSMHDLARLAERQGTMILHMELNPLHYYFVHANGATYRHVLGTGREDALTTESSPTEVNQMEFGRTKKFEDRASADQSEDNSADTGWAQGDLYGLPSSTGRANFGRGEITETVMLRRIKL